MIAAATATTTSVDGSSSTSSPSPPPHHNIQSRKSMKGEHFVGSRYGKTELDADSLEKCIEVFDQVDIDNSGSIDTHELLSMLLKLNIQIPNASKKPFIKALMKSIGKRADEELSLIEFQQLWSEYLQWKTEQELKEDKSLPWFPPVSGVHSTKLAIFLIFDDPSSCRIAQLTSIFVILTIALSVSTFVMETMPQFRTWDGGRVGAGTEQVPESFGIIEGFSIAVFSLEYVVRLLLVGFSPPDTSSFLSKFSSFLFHPMNVIDLLAIAPYYIELALPSDSGGSALGVLRILRVARVFRVFKLGKYSAGLQMFAQVILQSMSAMMLLMFFLVIAVVLFGSLIYYAERGEFSHELGGYARLDVTGQGYELTPFVSIPASFWWVVTTTTTVGYGDMYPTSVEGKIIGFVTMLIGILALALPVTIIGSNFANIYVKMRDEQLAADQKGIVDFVLSKTKDIGVDSDGSGDSNGSGSGSGGGGGGGSSSSSSVQIVPSGSKTTTNNEEEEEENSSAPPPSPPSPAPPPSSTNVEQALLKILARLESLESKVDKIAGQSS